MSTLHPATQRSASASASAVLPLSSDSSFGSASGLSPAVLPGARFGRFAVCGSAHDDPAGATYPAVAADSGDPAWLVVLPRPLVKAEPEIGRAYLEEARTAGTIRHPHLARLLAVAKQDGVFFAAWERSEAVTAEEWIARNGAMSPEQAIKIVRQAALGLGAVHDAGLTHREVRPGRLLIRPDGSVRLAGLGLARAAEEVQRFKTGLPIAAAPYAAPERYQSEGRSADPRSDIYSLGATMFHLLTGVPPFEGETTLQTLHKHVAEPVPDPAHVVPTLPDALRRLVRLMMAKNPADRPPDTPALIAELDSVRTQMAETGAGGSSLRLATAARPDGTRSGSGVRPGVGSGSSGRYPAASGLLPRRNRLEGVHVRGLSADDLPIEPVGGRPDIAAPPRPRSAAGLLLIAAGTAVALAAVSGVLLIGPLRTMTAAAGTGAETVPAGKRAPAAADAALPAASATPVGATVPAVTPAPAAPPASLAALPVPPPADPALASAEAAAELEKAAAEFSRLSDAAFEAERSDKAGEMRRAAASLREFAARHAAAADPRRRGFASEAADLAARLAKRGAPVRLTDRVRASHPAAAGAAAMHPSGRLSAHGCVHGSLFPTILRDDGLIERQPANPLSGGGHKGALTAVAFDPTPGAPAIATAGADKAVIIWRLAKDKLERSAVELPVGPAVSLAFSPDGKSLAAVGGDAVVRMIDPSAAKLTEPLPLDFPLQADGATEPTIPAVAAAVAVAYSPDGTSLAVGRADGGVAVWNFGAKAWRTAAAGLKGPVVSLMFAKDGSRLLASDAERVAVVSLTEPPAPSADGSAAAGAGVLALPVGGPAVLLPGARFVIAGRKPAVFAVGTGREIAALDGDTAKPVASMGLSASGDRLMTVDADGEIAFWRIDAASLASLVTARASP